MKWYDFKGPIHEDPMGAIIYKNNVRDELDNLTKYPNQTLQTKCKLLGITIQKARKYNETSPEEVEISYVIHFLDSEWKGSTLFFNLKARDYRARILFSAISKLLNKNIKKEDLKKKIENCEVTGIEQSVPINDLIFDAVFSFAKNKKGQVVQTNGFKSLEMKIVVPEVTQFVAPPTEPEPPAENTSDADKVIEELEF